MAQNRGLRERRRKRLLNPRLLLSGEGRIVQGIRTIGTPIGMVIGTAIGTGSNH